MRSRHSLAKEVSGSERPHKCPEEAKPGHSGRASQGVGFCLARRGRHKGRARGMTASPTKLFWISSSATRAQRMQTDSLPAAGERGRAHYSAARASGRLLPRAGPRCPVHDHPGPARA